MNQFVVAANNDAPNDSKNEGENDNQQQSTSAVNPVSEESMEIDDSVSILSVEMLGMVQWKIAARLFAKYSICNSISSFRA